MSSRGAWVVYRPWENKTPPVSVEDAALPPTPEGIGQPLAIDRTELAAFRASQKIGTGLRVTFWPMGVAWADVRDDTRPTREVSA